MVAGSAAQDALLPGLQSVLGAALPVAGASAAVHALRRLSGGASQETWAFDWGDASASRPLILRRAPPGAAQRDRGNPGLAAEAALIQHAGPAGVPVPQVVLVLQPQHGLGDGFIMQRLPGEALGRRLAAAHRPLLAQQCGAALARIHAMPLASLPPLRSTQPAAEVAYLRAWHARHGTARPVFQLALHWLAIHAPVMWRRCWCMVISATATCWSTCTPTAAA